MEKSVKIIRSKRNVAMFLLLDLLGYTTLTTAEIVSFMVSGRLTYTKGGRRIFSRDMKKIEDVLERFVDQAKNKIQVYELLSRLKKQNLIDKTSNSRASVWRITKRGLDKLGLFKSRCQFTSEPKNDDDLKIVIFDIPEKSRETRDWLRRVLRNLDYQLVQKSVFIGESKIPGEVMDQMTKLNLIPKYVKIFSVNKEGSLRD